MSTRLFPLLPAHEIHERELKSAQLNQQWLIEELIKPELPQLLETLTRCLELITTNDEVKLALTSTRSEQVKGVMTRQGSEIIHLDIHLSLNTFSKKLRLKMKDREHLELVQWTQLLKGINSSINAVLILQDYTGDSKGLFHKLNDVMSALSECNTVLNHPTDSLLFPRHKMPLTEVFEPEGKLLDHYKDRLTLDLFLLNSEITLELKSLALVTEEPWCRVDACGKSHIDIIRDDLKHHRLQLSDVLESERRSLGQVLGFQKFNTSDYITRGITFHDKVVIEVEKLAIHCQDPTLLSVGAKLSGLEHTVSKLYKNLDLAINQFPNK